MPTSLIFGKSGAGKTTACGEAALYHYRRTGKPGRAIYTDAGGCKPIQGLIDAGIVEPYNIIGERDFPLVVHKLAQGFWPSRLDGGLRPKDSKLLAPDFRNVGFYIVEGATSTAELFMKFLRDNPNSMGGDPIGKILIKDPDDAGKVVQFCSNNMKHYDWASSETLVMLAELNALPVHVLITAQEAAATDEEDRSSIRGPALVGKAGTVKVAKNVGDCIHLETYPTVKENLISVERRAFYQSHPDPKFPNVSYDCKCRVPLSHFKLVAERFPNGYFDPRLMGEFLEVVDAAAAASATELVGWKAKIDAERTTAGATTAAK